MNHLALYCRRAMPVLSLLLGFASLFYLWNQGFNYHENYFHQLQIKIHAPKLKLAAVQEKLKSYELKIEEESLEHFVVSKTTKQAPIEIIQGILRAFPQAKVYYHSPEIQLDMNQILKHGMIFLVLFAVIMALRTSVVETTAAVFSMLYAQVLGLGLLSFWNASLDNIDFITLYLSSFLGATMFMAYQSNNTNFSHIFFLIPLTGGLYFFSHVDSTIVLLLSIFAYAYALKWVMPVLVSGLEYCINHYASQKTSKEE